MVKKETEYEVQREEYNGWGYRHEQCAILFISLTVLYSIRSCMGVALVAMSEPLTTTSHDNRTGYTTHDNPSGVDNDNGTFREFSIEFSRDNVTGQLAMHVNESGSEHAVDNGNGSTLNGSEITHEVTGGLWHELMLAPPYRKVRWEKNAQQLVLSGFFWGYMVLQIPAGMMVQRFGPKRPLVAAAFLNSLLFLLLPWAAVHGGWQVTSWLRVLQGMAQACLVPGMHGLFGRWAPLQERGRLTGFAYGGQALGTVLGLPLTGFIAASPLGWPGVFRLYAFLAALIGTALYFRAADCPAKHKSISVVEREYIERGVGGGKEAAAVPWRSLLTSAPLWAIVCAHVGNSWGQIFLFTELPLYMQRVMGLNIKANGLLSALPFLAMWISNFAWSAIADILVNKTSLSLTAARKLANSVGSVGAATGLICLAYTPRNMWLVETALVFVCSFKIATHMGFQVNHIDLCPPFAGTSMSVSNFVGNGVGSFAPLITSWLIDDVTSSQSWRRAFFLAAAIYLVTNSVYLFLGSAELAEWAKVEDQNGVRRGSRRGSNRGSKRVKEDEEIALKKRESC